MSIHRNDFLTLWKLSRAGDEARIQEYIAESDAVARNLVNLKHHCKGTSPLMEAAASKCNEPVVAQLIAAGADVNDVDDTKLKNTALHYAAMTNADPLTIEALLEAGANAFAVNRKGFTPLDVARQSGRKTAGAALLEHMKVHAGWLFLRGKFHWKKRWAVVVACNKQRTSTELCIFRGLNDLRPSVVMLIDEAARMVHFSSTDSYSWLQRDNAFVFDKPVMCHYVKKEKFTRSPICKKTMSLVNVQTLHCVFAADSLNNLAQWRHVLESSNFQSRESQSVLRCSSLFQSQNGELYYWPHELVDNLRATILQEQEQEREQANDPVQQRLRATFEERRASLASTPAPAPAPVANLSTFNEQTLEAAQMSMQPSGLHNEAFGEPPQNLQRHATSDQSVDRSIALQNDGRSRVHFTPFSEKQMEAPVAAKSSYTDRQQTQSNVSNDSESETNSIGPEFVTEVVIATENDSKEFKPEESSLQDKSKAEEDDNNQKQHDEDLQLSDAPEKSSSPGCKICGMARQNAVCTPCGHQIGCTSCVKTVMRTSTGCPVCRMPMLSVLSVGSD
ncbi:unnamed protein product [Peronospora belbahrii]|uniref:RING-type domain-containing protein n=1 Tax=Peronospora belbahrii TaxID=622444 RepID=A0ABN8CWJ3_9STRA|nr:unnamed protein product [Peronospora belbahrii]